MPSGRTRSQIGAIINNSDVRYHERARVDDILTMLATEAKRDLPTALTRDALIVWLQNQWKHDSQTTPLVAAHRLVSNENNSLRIQLAGLREVIAHLEAERGAPLGDNDD